MKKLIQVFLLLFALEQVSSASFFGSIFNPEPTVTHIPLDNETNVSPDVVIKLTYGEDISQSFLSSENVVLTHTTSGTRIDGTVAYTEEDKTITFTPLNSLEPGKYHIKYTDILKKKTSFFFFSYVTLECVEFDFEVAQDTTPPVITLNGNSNITLTQGDTYIEEGATALDEQDGVVTVDISGSVDTSIIGTYTINYTATDTQGNRSTVQRSVEVIVPSVTLESLTLSSTYSLLRVSQKSKISLIGIYSDGTQQDVTLDAIYNISNLDIVDISGTELEAVSTGTTSVSASMDGITSNSINIEVKEPIDTSNFNVTNFGTQYIEHIPNDATKEKYDEELFSMITGKVFGEDSSALSGVKVVIHNHPEYGSQITDSNGSYSFATEGGFPIIMRYSKDGYTTLDRKVYAKVRDWNVAPDVTMLKKDTKVTTISFVNTAPQIHVSTPVIDDRGQRSTTLVFDNISKATITAKDGSTRILDVINVRATEFKTPESMPADLPIASAFTYCSDLEVDGVSDDENVTFDAPVVMYVDNFLGFAVGEIVPVGYYDRNSGTWKCSENGVVVSLLDTDSDGVIDALDSDGDGLPDDLNNNGSFEDEVAGIKDNAQYMAGQTYWRANFIHFTPWDYNWPYGPPADAEEPEDFDYEKEEEEEEEECEINSYVKPKTRVFHEDIKIAGTDITLHYSSKRVPGYIHNIEVSLNSTNIPSSAKNVIAELQIAGQTLKQYPTLNSLTKLMFKWDGKDSLGNYLEGEVNAKLKIGYIYDGVYYRASSEFQSAWAQVGSSATAIQTRDEIILWNTQDISIVVERATSADSIANGWTISNKDRALKSLIQTGDGNLINNEFVRLYDKKLLEDISNISTPYDTINGIDVYYILLTSDKYDNLYILDSWNSTIYKKDNLGNLTVFAGTGTSGVSPDGGLAKESSLYYPTSAIVDDNGDFYFADIRGTTIRKIDKNGVLTTIYGTSQIDLSTEPNIEDYEFGAFSLKFDNYGVLHFVDALNFQIKKLDSCGNIVTVLENYYPYMIDFDTDGNLFFLDNVLTIKKINQFGKVSTVYDINENLPEDFPYYENSLGAFAIDNSNNIFFVDNGYNRLVKRASDGSHITVMGTDEFVTAEDTDILGWINISEKDDVYISNIQAEVFKLIKNKLYNEYNLDDNDLLYKMKDNTAKIFDKFGKEIKTIDLSTGNTLKEFIYSADNRLLSSIDQFGNTLTVERDSNGNPTVITAPNGQKTYLEVDAKGDLLSVSYEDSSSYIFEYDENSLMTKETDQNSYEHFNLFDTNGRIYQETDAVGAQWKFFKESSGKTKTYTMVKPENDEIVTTTIKQPDGSSVSTITLASGDSYLTMSSLDGTNLNSEINSVSTYITTKYDKVEQREILESRTITQPSGLSLVEQYTNSYDKNETHIFSKTQTINLNSKVTTVIDDYQNATKSVTTPQNRITTLSYDKNTRLTSNIKSGSLTQALYEYDTKGRVVSETIGNRVTAYTYDVRGNIATVTNPKNETTSYTYDVMDRVTKITYANGIEEQYSYDANGNIIRLTTPTPTDFTFTYNGVDQRTSLISPSNYSTTYVYNKNRKLTTVTRPSGNTIINNYANDRLSSTVMLEGTINYSYVFADQLASITMGTESIEYGYDGDLLTSLSQNGILNQSIDYSYNNDFLVTSSTYAGSTTNYTYDNDDLLTSSGAFTITRDSDNGYVTQVSDGTLTINKMYNNYGELSSSSDNSFTYELQRDLNGRIIEKTEVLNGLSGTYIYTYDSIGRLVQVEKNNQIVESYTYDKNSNRISATLNGITTQASYNQEDAIDTYGDNLYTYDIDGQLTQKITSEGITTYSYTTQGTLTKVVTPTNTIEYILNPLGQRVAKKVDGQIIEKYLWADLTTLLAIYDGNDNLVQRYNYTDNRVPISLTQDGEIYYLHYDQVGTLKAISDTNHNIVKEISYDTYGNILQDSNPNFKIPFGFAGGLYDQDTQLVHFGYREYDPQTGKWTTKDPIDFSGGDTNLYGYVLQDPVNLVDPEGLYIWEILAPTDMGPNTTVIVDKNGNKSVYDFDTGNTKPYLEKKKVYCETRKSDFESSENAKNNELDKFSRDYRLKPRGNRSENLESLWDALGTVFGLFK